MSFDKEKHFNPKKMRVQMQIQTALKIVIYVSNTEHSNNGKSYHSLEHPTISTMDPIIYGGNRTSHLTIIQR